MKENDAVSAGITLLSVRKKPHDPPYQRGRTLSSLVTLELSPACPLWPRPCLAHPPLPDAAHRLLVAAQHQLAAPPLLPTMPSVADHPGASVQLPSPPCLPQCPPTASALGRGEPLRDRTSCLPALVNWTRAGHMAQARPTRLGFGLKDPGRSPWEETGPLGWSLELPCGLQREGLEQG